MHNHTCGLNLAPNHKIVLTAQNYERILLLAHVSRLLLSQPETKALGSESALTQREASIGVRQLTSRKEKH